MGAVVSIHSQLSATNPPRHAPPYSNPNTHLSLPGLPLKLRVRPAPALLVIVTNRPPRLPVLLVIVVVLLLALLPSTPPPRQALPTLLGGRAVRRVVVMVVAIAAAPTCPPTPPVVVCWVARSVNQQLIIFSTPCLPVQARTLRLLRRRRRRHRCRPNRRAPSTRPRPDSPAYGGGPKQKGAKRWMVQGGACEINRMMHIESIRTT